MSQSGRLIQFSVAAVAAAFIGCTGAQSDKSTGPDGAGEGGQDGVEDLVFNQYKTTQLKGMLFEPEALGRPPMVSVEGAGKGSIKRLRGRAKAALERGKARGVHLFVTRLWKAADKAAQKSPERAEKFRAEAGETLAKLREKLGDDVDAVTLQMDAVAKQAAGDTEGAIAAYEMLLDKHADAEGIEGVDTWLAYLYLRGHRNADAAKIAGEYDLEDDELGGHKAYVAAWAAYRQGDFERAREAIAIAAKRWPSRTGQKAVVRDILLMIARAGTPVEDADKAISDVVGGNPQQRFVLLHRLHEGYVYAGYYGLASQTLEHLLTNVFEDREVPPSNQVGFLYRQSDYEFRMNNPAEAAEYAIAAYDKLEACGEQCAGETADAVVKRISDLASMFHTSYATSLDDRYYEPAEKLYAAYVEIPDRDDTDKIQQYLDNLKESKKNADVSQGKHDEEVMANLVVARREVVKACYEAALGADPELAGSLTVTLQVDENGEVAGSGTQPPAGEEGLARVGKCALERAQNWTFPSRTVPGMTALVFPFELAGQTETRGKPGAGGGPAQSEGKPGKGKPGKGKPGKGAASSAP